MAMRVLVLLGAALLAAAQSRTVSDAEVMRVHRSALLIDTHNDVTSRTVEGFDIGPRNTSDRPTHTDLVRMKEGGMGAQFFAVYVAASYVNGNHSANRTLQMIDTVRHDIIAKYPHDFMYATSAADIEAAHKKGKIAALMGIEGGHAIEDSLRLLRDYYVLGVRYMTLTHANTNNWADSSGDVTRSDVQHHNGLTDFGKDVVREMNRLGMMVDISHVADKTFWDALEVSKAPIFASHSSSRALADVPRNMTDEMIVALAKKGGVVQVNFYDGFVDEDYRRAMIAQAKDQAAAVDAYMAQRKAEGKEVNYIEVDRIEREWMTKIPRPPLKALIDHIDHVAKVAGVDHVGLGSDFDGVSGATPQ